MRALVMAAAVALLLWGCGPKMDGLEKGETGTGAEVRDGDTFKLSNGLVVYLAGVEAPRSGEPRADESRAALEKLVSQRPVQLAYGGQKRLRDAAIAHAFVRTEGGRWIWVQQALLLSGDVRVHTRCDNIARLDEMRAAEAEARKARKGLWALPQFAVRKAADVARSEADIAADPACAEELATHAETDKPTAGVEKAALEKDSAKSADDRPQRPRRKREFLIVEGRVTDIAARERAVFLNFGADISRDFAVLVPKEAADAWPGGAGALDALKGRSVRVRGDTPRCARPLMRIDHAAQIEVLDGPTAPTSTAPTAKAP